MKPESVVIAYQYHAVNTSLLLAHTARQTMRVGSDCGHAFWRFRIWASRVGLSRNKVAVGESAAGSPPKAAHNRVPVSYTHLRAHETRHDLVCRLLLEKK